MAPLRPLQPPLHHRLRPAVPASSLLALIAVLLCFAAPATADVYDDNPATASRGPGDAWIFARALDGTTLERHLVNGDWTDWSSLGGNSTSGPAAVAAPGGRLHVFIRGSAGDVQENVYDSGTWSGWSSLGGYVLSAPGASWRRGVNSIDLAATGGDAAGTFRWNAGAGWSGWGVLGGTPTSAPSLDSFASGLINVAVRGSDGALKIKHYDGTAWSDWMNFGARMIGAPAIIARTANVQTIFVRALDSRIYASRWAAGDVEWSAYTAIDPRAVESSPAAAGDGPGKEWVVVRGGNGLLYNEWRAGGGWSGWTDLGPVAVPAPPQPTAPAPTPTPAGDVDLEASAGCTPAGGLLRVRISVKQVKGKMVRVTFFTKGKGRKVKTDKKAPFDVRIKVNRPAGKSGRVYARLYYKRGGRLRDKTVSGRYSVCK